MNETDRQIVDAQRQETKSDRIGLVLFVALICAAFVVLVFAGYGSESLFSALGRLFQ